MIRQLAYVVVMWTVLAGCSHCCLLPEALDVSLRNDKDQWELTCDTAGPVLLITSPSGIGEATVRLLDSRPCASFAVGLRYADGQPFERLEGFSVVNGSGDRWENPPWSVGCGYMRVALPQAVFESGDSSLTIQWVDMYRTK
jgi:hypothetical protein